MRGSILEDARAGEAGKGFAVVASEVKSLAHKSSDAAGVIKEKLGEIGRISGDTSGEIHRIEGVIASINEIITRISLSSEEQARSASSIAGNISDMAEGLKDIRENVLTSDKAIQVNDHEIEAIAASAGNVDAESRTVENLSNDLFTFSEKLKADLSLFTV